MVSIHLVGLHRLRFLLEKASTGTYRPCYTNIMKVAVVTGASSGIGRATAVSLAKSGYTVVVNYKTNKKGAQEVVDECNKYSEGTIAVQADVADEESVAALFEQVRAKLEHVDVLVNNAGIFDEQDGTTSVAAFEHTYSNNFLSYVLATKHVLPLMQSGKIVNVSSIHGRLGHGRPEAAAYSASKAAVESWTKNLAKDLAPNILVNAVAPGRVNTPMWDATDVEQKELGKAHLIERMIDADEVADAILFLVKNNAVCGEVLTIDGGMSLVTLG